MTAVREHKVEIGNVRVQAGSEGNACESSAVTGGGGCASSHHATLVADNYSIPFNCMARFSDKISLSRKQT